MLPDKYWLPAFWTLTYFLTSYTVSSYTPKKVVYMDRENTCNRVLHDDGLSEGDSYEIKSDKKIEGGLSKWSDRQYITLCPVGINFGDRLIAVIVERWWCEKADSDAYLALYSDCTGRRKGLLKWFNSSNQYPLAPVYSPRSCVTLVFYRGRQTNRGGCHFEINIVARYEMFPAFKISAVIISSIVLLMILVKIVCVITGYERRLPNVNVNVEEHKFILSEHSSTDNAVLQQAEETDASGQDRGQRSSFSAQSRDTERDCGLLTAVTSADPDMAGCTSGDVYYPEYCDVTPKSKLKHYPTCKTSSIWGN